MQFRIDTDCSVIVEWAGYKKIVYKNTKYPDHANILYISAPEDAVITIKKYNE